MLYLKVHGAFLVSQLWIRKPVRRNTQCLHRRRPVSPLRKLLSLCRASSIPEWAVTVLYLPYGRHSRAQPDILPPNTFCQTLWKLLGASLWRDRYCTLNPLIPWMARVLAVKGFLHPNHKSTNPWWCLASYTDHSVICTNIFMYLPLRVLLTPQCNNTVCLWCPKL